MENKRSYRHLFGGIGWPVKDLPGYCCIVGSCARPGQARPAIYLLDERGDEGVKVFCQKVLELDLLFAPETWMANLEDDFALATMRIQNERVKTPLAGKSYEAYAAPWHRRTIHISEPSIFQMTGGLRFGLSVIRELRKEKRLHIEDNLNIIHEQLLTISKEDAGGEDLTDNPVLCALSACVIEAEQWSTREQAQLNAPEPRKYDRLRHNIRPGY